MMLTKIRQLSCAAVVACAMATAAAAQSAANPNARPTPLAQTDTSALRRGPAQPARPFVVRTAQALDELQKSLKPGNKAEDLTGGAGSQLRVAVVHEKGKAGDPAEVHDASDDVYYVLDGSATLVLGGALDSPREAEPGEWRAARIVGGQTVVINKGDVVVVPRGTPHQRSTEGKDFTMLLVKIWAEPLPAPAAQPAAPAAKPKP